MTEPLDADPAAGPAPRPDRDRAWWWRLAGRGTDPVIVACLANLLLGIWVIGVVPVFDQADEAFHYAAVLTVSDGDGWPATADALQDERLPKSVARLREQWNGDYTVAEAPTDPLPPDGPARDALQQACQRDPATCPTTLVLPDWGDGNTARVNRAVQHPPFYYAVTAAEVSLAAGLVPPLLGLEAGQSVLLVRLLTLLAILPVPWLAARVARELDLGRAAEVTAAAATLAIPAYYYAGPGSISPDALLVVLASWATLLVVRIHQDSSPRDLVWLGVALGLTSFTKAPGLLVVVAAAVVLAPVLLRGGLAAATRRLALVGIPAFLAGGWWWLRNLLVIGSFQPLLNNPPDAEPVALTRARVLDATLEWSERSMRAFWGLFLVPGRASAPLLFWLTLAAVAIAVVGAIFFLGRARMGVFSLVMIGGTVGMVWLTMLARLASLGSIRAVQGRYLYPTIVLLAVGLAAALVRGSRRLGIPPVVVPLVVTAGVVLWQVRAALVWLRLYGADDDLVTRLRAWVAWYPGPDWLAVVTTGLLGLVAVAWLAAVVADRAALVDVPAAARD